MIAGTDCGFSTVAGYTMVAEDVVWEKLRALADGASIASRRLRHRVGGKTAKLDPAKKAKQAAVQKGRRRDTKPSARKPTSRRKVKK